MISSFRASTSFFKASRFSEGCFIGVLAPFGRPGPRFGVGVCFGLFGGRPRGFLEGVCCCCSSVSERIRLFASFEMGEDSRASSVTFATAIFFPWLFVASVRVCLFLLPGGRPLGMFVCGGWQGCDSGP